MTLFISIGCLIVLGLHFTNVDGLNETNRLIDGTETNSFVVNANYNVQGDNTKSPDSQYHNVPSTFSSVHQEQAEILPTPSYWRASSQNFQPKSSYSIYEDQAGSATTPYSHYTSENNYSSNKLNANEINSPHYSNYSPTGTYPEKVSLKNTNDKIGDVVYGSSNVETQTIWPKSFQETFDNSYRPNIKELEQIIKKLIQGSTKIHQVVKVPAVYEIHLRGEEEPLTPHEIKHHTAPVNHYEAPDISEIPLQSNQWNFAHPVGQLNHQDPSTRNNYFPTSYLQGDILQTWRSNWRENKPLPRNNFRNYRGSRQTNKPWMNSVHSSSSGISEIPPPVLGNYPRHQPFPANYIVKNSWPIKSSSASQPSRINTVNVPISPGSTAVTFSNQFNPSPLNYRGRTQMLKTPDVLPNLNIYYAKKKELENENASTKHNGYNNYRRNSLSNNKVKKQNGKIYKKSDNGLYINPSKLNYFIYVKEKPENKKIIYV